MLRVAESAEDLADVAKQTEQEAAKGMSSIQQVNKQMGQISDSVLSTAEIVSWFKRTLFSY